MSFIIDILAFVQFRGFLAYFKKIGPFFSKTSGHPVGLGGEGLVARSILSLPTQKVIDQLLPVTNPEDPPQPIHNLTSQINPEGPSIPLNQC